MALRQLILSKKIEEARNQLSQLEKEQEALSERRTAMNTREAELEQAINEVTVDTPAEDQAVLEEEEKKWEEEDAALQAEEQDNAAKQQELQTKIDELNEELDALNKKADADEPAPEPAPADDRGADIAENREERQATKMNIRTMFGSTQQREALFARDDVKQFAERIRRLGKEKRAVSGGQLLIPEVLLPMIRQAVEERSQLIKYVNLQQVGGTARETVMGTMPEAVWTEMCAKLNELNLVFNDVEVDGYKVGGYIPVCNALLEDNDVNLVSQVLWAMMCAIAVALDKAILYGTGTKMPLGIVTRLAQTSAPADYPTTARPWVDLHTSNIQKIGSSVTGIALFQQLLLTFGAAKKKYGAGGRFWAMNEKTHTKLVAEAMSFNAAGAIVSGVENTMPVIGGDIVELDFIPDDNIIAGYGELYLMVERAGVEVASSEHFMFTSDKTVYKATARYDGLPVIAEGFVAIGINNTDASTSMSFDPDDANDVTSIRMNTATATVAANSTLQLRAITEPGTGTVTWTSATTAKATVDSNGLVTGVASGSSVITATCNGLSASCTVTVTA